MTVRLSPIAHMRGLYENYQIDQRENLGNVGTTKVDYRMQYYNTNTNPRWRTATKNRYVGISYEKMTRLCGNLVV